MRAIFHADREWGIGRGNALMFRLPKDMKFFRETTLGKAVVMGRGTLLSFPGGKPLKDRMNIVLSTKLAEGDAEGNVAVARDLNGLFKILEKYPPDDVFVIGGASVYRLLIPYCSAALVTKVDAIGGADAFAPNLDEDPLFRLVQDSGPVEDNGYSIRFCTYQNLAVKKF